MTIQGITEEDIANYLANTPGFFERHAELLASIQLTSPHGHRAVSLQERQMEMLREKIKGLERRIMEMIRHGQENMAIADRLHLWTTQFMQVADAKLLPATMVDKLQRDFLVPQAAIKVWGVDGAFADEGFAGGVSDDAKSFATSLTSPYCGLNSGFEAVRWLADPGTVASVALVPLRNDVVGPAFGLLVLASPDATRFSGEMGTEFLTRIGELASAGLSRLLPTG
jgi:uncharacterized protein